MKSRFALTAILATMIVAYVAVITSAGGILHRCGHCNCDCECTKVCRLVVEEKKVQVVCWGCKCEDFCLPGPSDRGCKNCEEVCDDCTEKDKDICTALKEVRLVRLVPKRLRQDLHKDKTDEEDRHENGPKLQMGC